MTETRASSQRKNPLSLRVILLSAQILIPFGLYWAMNQSSPFWMSICAAAFVISMGLLVWLR